MGQNVIPVVTRTKVWKYRYLKKPSWIREYGTMSPYHAGELLSTLQRVGVPEKAITLVARMPQAAVKVDESRIPKPILSVLLRLPGHKCVEGKPPASLHEDLLLNDEEGNEEASLAQGALDAPAQGDAQPEVAPPA